MPWDNPQDWNKLHFASMRSDHKGATGMHCASSSPSSSPVTVEKLVCKQLFMHCWCFCFEIPPGVAKVEGRSRS